MKENSVYLFFSLMHEIYWEASKGDFFKALIQDHESLSFFFIYLQITG